MDENHESKPLIAEVDGRNPNTTRQSVEDNLSDDITMKKTTEEEREELSENEAPDVAEQEDQISRKERHKCSECNKR